VDIVGLLNHFFLCKLNSERVFTISHLDLKFQEIWLNQVEEI
jgi:hypothetical protein